MSNDQGSGSFYSAANIMVLGNIPERQHHSPIVVICHFLTSPNKTPFWDFGGSLRVKCPFPCWSLIECFYPEVWLTSEWSKDRGMKRPAWQLWWWLCLLLVVATFWTFFLLSSLAWFLTIFQICELPNIFQWITLLWKLVRICFCSLQFSDTEICTRECATGSEEL